MADFKPLGISIGILLIIGILCPYLLSFIFDIGEIETSPIADGLSSIISNPWTIDLTFIEFNVNPFGLLPDSLIDKIVECITFLGLLPSWLVWIIVIMFSVVIIFTIITLVRGN